MTAEIVPRQREARARLFGLAREHDVLLAATGTHPWSPWQEQRLIDTPTTAAWARRLEAGNRIDDVCGAEVKETQRTYAACDTTNPEPGLIADGTNR